MFDQDTKSIFDIEPDEAAEAALDAEAEADCRAGRIVSNDKVIAWLNSWGSDDELPAPSSQSP